MFNLNKYTWSIFDIAAENGVDIGVGKDMFLENVEKGQAVHPGADLDYAELSGQWAALSDDERAAQKIAYGKMTRALYEPLTALRRAGDKAAFQAAVEAGEPTEDGETGE